MTHIRSASRMQDEDLTEIKRCSTISHSISVKDVLGTNTAHCHARVSAFASPQTATHDACRNSRTSQKVRKRTDESKSSKFRWTKICYDQVNMHTPPYKVLRVTIQTLGKLCPDLGRKRVILLRIAPRKR